MVVQMSAPIPHPHPHPRRQQESPVWGRQLSKNTCVMMFYDFYVKGQENHRMDIIKSIKTLYWVMDKTDN